MDNILSKDLIKEWGLQSMTPEKQVEIVERLGRMIYQAVLVRSLDILSEKEQIELDLLLDEDTTTAEDVLAFLQKKIPTFEKMVLDERQSIKDDVLMPIS